MVAAELNNTGTKGELQQIMEHIRNSANFLLSGGAGSGKTYTLVQVIKQVIEENPTSKIACMTYTNAAVKEIEERVNHKNLNVSTIHDFLWDAIKHFQKELKLSLIDLANDEDINRIKIDDINPVPADFFNGLENGIQYKEYLKIKEGIISHDELLILANHMFNNHPKLCDILKDKCNFIFVDEYPDTQKGVIEILLLHLKQSQKKNIVGFFGDAMQSIYDDGIGNIDIYKGEEEGKVKEVKKEQNRRNPRLVIELANKLRTDGLIQKPSNDKNAPNMTEYSKVKEGNIKFIYSANSDLQKVKKYLAWDFGDSKETKELNLTHNLIAGKAGFRILMDIYDKDPILGLKKDILKKMKSNKKSNKPEIEIIEDESFDSVVDKFQLKNKQKELKKDVLLKTPDNVALYEQMKNLPFSFVRKLYINKDQLIDDKKQDEEDENKKGSKRDDLIKHLFKIQTNISLYKNRQFSEFLKVTDFNVDSIQKKRKLKKNIESLINVGDKTIEEVIKDADEKGICKSDDRLSRFQKEKEYVYNRVKSVKFEEFQKLYDYLEGRTPFSTQHKIKGTEFNNVLVVLDNANWTKYDFENLFLGSGTASVLERSQKIFYVCCTRTKENLAVYFNKPCERVINKAKKWFGESNVIDLDKVSV